MKKITIGILAHVDAGKTTLTESILHITGNIKTLGRVDHGNSYLDYDVQERDRGITIFSKEARFSYQDTAYTLIDTPGHIDFSTEMERTLQVLDYAIMVINGNDGIQSHSETIWTLLKHYHVPCFIFVNKMDMEKANHDMLMSNIKDKLDERCIDFSLENDALYESIALTNDTLLEYYLEHHRIDKNSIMNRITNRELFPCLFGSALKNVGVKELLDVLTIYSKEKQYSEKFGARVYKISRDHQSNRLTHVKITGGKLRVKEKIVAEEKVDQIRLYSGEKYQMIDEVIAGDVCALKGLKSTTVGQGLGYEQEESKPVLLPFMNYRIILPSGVDEHKMYSNLQIIAEEDPQLHITYNTQSKDIHIQLMGKIQIEVLKNIIKDRFGIEVDFDQGRIIYKETITQTIEGVGHFEPLRHYAEVHLLLKPGKRGSGLQFFTDCKEDVLASHWQRLVLTHLREKEHIGVLTGSPITDMKITLVAGKAHQKHTEGGDFRQATYRAIRQGLKSTTSIVLEPYYSFRLEVPAEFISKAIYDIESMNGDFTIVDSSSSTVITGKAPVSKMQSYYQQVLSYTKGQGRLQCSLKGYEPCINQQQVIEEIGYNSESDMDNPTNSVFCKQGAGFTVPWNEVPEFMHLPFTLKKKEKIEVQEPKVHHLGNVGDKELEDIFTRTYGPTKRKLSSKDSYEKKSHQKEESRKVLPECILIDGYNVIHAWDELKDLAYHDLGAAREKLMDILCNYQGYKQCMVIVVFDGYKVKGAIGTSQKYNNIYVVYTKEAQTADTYIERTTHALANQYHVVVATSDALEQLIVIGHGAHRISSRELKLEIEYLTKEKLNAFQSKQKIRRNYLLEDLQEYNDE